MRCGRFFMRISPMETKQKQSKNPFKLLRPFDIALWSVSVLVITLSFVFSPRKDPLTLCSSLVGVSSLVFIAKGNIWGQILMIAFALSYGVVSFFFRYWGEMITYLCMSLPAAVFSLVSWIRHPFEQSQQVAVGSLNAKKVAGVALLSAAATAAFYFILRALETPNLLFSTLSVTTSVLAASLSFLRSPFYALAYTGNDLVLIVLWSLAAYADMSYFPMIFCFVMFLFNDINGFVNWRLRLKRQRAALAAQTAATPCETSDPQNS